MHWTSRCRRRSNTAGRGKSPHNGATAGESHGDTVSHPVRPRHPVRALSWALALAALAPIAHADVDLPTDTRRLANMSLEDLLQTEVTTLAGTAAPHFSTPAAMSVITADEIRRAGHRSLPEALRMVPGMFVARVNASSWTVGSRGLTGSSLTSNRYLVLIDGRLVYDPLISATLWDAVDLPLADVERIEVVRGPGASLWGVNAMNGVINVVTRDARDTVGTLLQVGAGTQGERNAYLRHGARVSADSALRLWASYSSQREFEDASGNGIHDGWSRARFGLRWDGTLANGLDFSAQAGAYDFPTADTRVRLPVPARHNEFEVRTQQDTIRGGHAQFTLGNPLTTDAGWSLKAFVDRNERETSRFAVDRETADIEYRHWSHWGERQQLIWGANWNHTRDETTPGPVLQFDPARRSWSTLNVFAQNTTELVEDTAYLMIGTKVTDHEFVGVQLQPSIRAWWTPSTRQTWWAAVSRPVRVPSRLEEDGLLVFAYADAGVLTTGQPNGVILPIGLGGDDRLPAEELVAYELGHRIQLSPKLAIGTTVFYHDYKRLVGVPPAIVGTFNDDATGATWGGDIAVAARWTDNWRMEASYSRLQTRISGPVLQFDEIGTPKQMGQVRSYLDLGESMEFNAAAYYVDEVPFLGVSDYTRLDLGLTWRAGPRWRMALWGQNLLESGHSEGSGAQVPRGVYAEITVDVGG